MQDAQSHEQGTSVRGDLAEIDGAASILEELLIEVGRLADRGVIRRVVREAETAFPGTPAERWWRWIGEAGTNLGLKCKVVDCTSSELVELARQGVKFVVYVPGISPWRAVIRSHRRKFLLARASEEPPSKWGDSSRLLKLIGSPDGHALIRCVLIEPALAYADAGTSDHAEEMTPLARVFALLRPERGDIFILIIFSVVVGLLSLATPIAVDSLVTTVAFGRMIQPLVLLALLLFGFLAFSAALRALQAYMTEIIQCRLFARVAADLSYRLPRVRMESIERHYLPELANRFFDVVTVQKVTASFLLDGLQLAINAIVGMAVLAVYHPWLLGFDVVLLSLLAFIIFILGRGAVTTSIKESKCKYQIADWLENLARCAVAFKLDGGAEFALERGDQLIHDYLVARKKHFRILIGQVVFALGLQAVASAVLLGIGGWLVMRGQLTLGQLVAAELIVTVIVGSFAKLGKSMESFYDLMAATDKLGVLFDLPIEEQEGVLHQFPARPASLIVHDVEYSFTNGVTALQPSIFEIQRGGTVALTGNGKSVLLDLIFGLRTPRHGHLTVDGIDIRDLRPDFLRRRVALVRGIEVFHGSVAENVHLARPEITVNTVRDALEQVGLLADVSQLPGGIASELISGGAPLTENQLRRLMLARAIAGRPGLLLIDGLLDALPDHEAGELLQMLGDSRQPWTLILVTGRTSLHDHCTRVIELGSDLDSEVVEPTETKHE
ncbi:MAG TPA: ABC transporter ATP-binding protein [Pirellulaceae bacterium]|nr:ABC transporter ATP-binding protein [Planctomycetales bacterium]MCB9940241.1 ABC transporter ATP-binding protein [Planctomycetaceae bacterium]HRX79784.1 ABC transporter ATP-binding protein [Pirellulaceae bacterium]